MSYLKLIANFLQIKLFFCNKWGSDVAKKVVQAANGGIIDRNPSFLKCAAWFQMTVLLSEVSLFTYMENVVLT